MAVDIALRHRRYRRFLAGSAIDLGVLAGVGLGSVAVSAGSPWLILLLAFPLGLRVVGSASGRLKTVDRVSWLWPLTAIPVTFATLLLMPPDLAPIALGLVVAGWFLLIVSVGVLEVLLDPDGRLASGTG
jgi:hypothetical protein